MSIFIPNQRKLLGAGPEELGNRAAVLEQEAYVQTAVQPQTFPQGILLQFDGHGDALPPIEFPPFLGECVQALRKQHLTPGLPGSAFSRKDKLPGEEAGIRIYANRLFRIKVEPENKFRRFIGRRKKPLKRNDGCLGVFKRGTKVKAYQLHTLAV